MRMDRDLFVLAAGMSLCICWSGTACVRSLDMFGFHLLGHRWRRGGVGGYLVPDVAMREPLAETWVQSRDADISFSSSSPHSVAEYSAAVVDVEAENSGASVELGSFARKRKYSFVVSKGTWFENIFQDHVEVEQNVALLSGIAVSRRPQAYLMPSGEVLPSGIIPRIDAGEAAVYFCVHNPLKDCSILELRDVVSKAEKDVFVVLVFPELRFLEESLQIPCDVVTGSRKAHVDARLVSSFADFDCWLRVYSSGIFSKSVLILPYREELFIRKSDVVKLCREIGLLRE